MSDKTTFPLRLPKSWKQAAERLAKENNTSLNHFISLSVAEKIATLDTARYFEERAKHADLAAFDRILNREGGEPPGPGDEIPEDYTRPE